MVSPLSSVVEEALFLEEEDYNRPLAHSQLIIMYLHFVSERVTL